MRTESSQYDPRVSAATAAAATENRLDAAQHSFAARSAIFV